MTFSGVLSAFFRFAIALVSFRLGPSGSLRAAISMSVSSIKASKSICSDSRIGCIDVRLLAVRNLCRGVHSSSVSSPSVDERRQRYRDDIETYRAYSCRKIQLTRKQIVVPQALSTRQAAGTSYTDLFVVSVRAELVTVYGSVYRTICGRTTVLRLKIRLRDR